MHRVKRRRTLTASQSWCTLRLVSNTPSTFAISTSFAALATRSADMLDSSRAHAELASPAVTATSAGSSWTVAATATAGARGPGCGPRV